MVHLLSVTEPLLGPLIKQSGYKQTDMRDNQEQWKKTTVLLKEAMKEQNEN